MKEKKRIIVLIIFLIILLLVFGATRILNMLSSSMKTDNNIRYPDSTLTDKEGNYDYEVLYFLNNRTNLPNSNLFVSLPDREVESTSNTLSLNYNYFDIVISDSECIEFSAAVSDSGYLGYNKASYTAGCKDDYYIICYNIFFGEEPFWFYIKSLKPMYLADQKTVIEAIISTVTEGVAESENEVEPDTEFVSDTEPETEEEETEINDPHNNWVKENDVMGDEYLYTEKDIEVLTDQTRNNYVVFDWWEVDVSPSEAYLVGPYGDKYYKDPDESYGSSIVFHIEDAVNGTYVLHATTKESLGHCDINSYTRAEYLAIFYNQDENGEPLRSFEE